MKSDQILFSIKQDNGIITLNNPNNLNALDLKMVQDLYLILKEWKNNNSIKRVLLKGNGKAFCAGGNVKNLYISSNKDNLKKKFFQIEYRLNNLINNFSKPIMSIWDGLVMGGGVGISIYGSTRIATENSKFAMPETAIGFFPDVGASYFLSKLEHIGLYLALTGKICNPEEMIYLKLATHYTSSKNIENIINDFLKNGEIQLLNPKIKNDSIFIKNNKIIKDTFYGDIHSIMKNLKNSNEDFARETYLHLLKRCPMSLAVTTELINLSKEKSLTECLKTEYKLCQNMVYRDDFNNGVESVLITKNHKPKWNPNSIHDIDQEEVKKLFDIKKEELIL